MKNSVETHEMCGKLKVMTLFLKTINNMVVIGCILKTNKHI